MKRVLYISPHLDDAALSCAGAIAASRDEVFVATIFTEGRNARARKREDRAAFGKRALHLGFLDAPERLQLEPSFASLCLRPRLDPRLVREVRAALRALASGFDELWFPLAIGGHIDHRTVFAAAPARANFYEELPYARVAALRQQRYFTRAQIARQVRRAMPGLISAECLDEIARLPLRTFPGSPSARRFAVTPAARALLLAYPSQRAFASPYAESRIERCWKVPVAGSSHTSQRFGLPASQSY